MSEIRLTCTECEVEFDPGEFPYCCNVTCPGCGVELETDTEYDQDARYCWVVGPVREDDQ